MIVILLYLWHIKNEYAMERLLQSIKININEKIFVKDPESSNLGKRIIEESIHMIHEMGFESFTFKKLGTHQGAINEAARLGTDHPADD